MKYFRLSATLCFAFLISGCCITPPNFAPDGGNIRYVPELSYRYSGYWGKDAKDADFKHVGGMGFGMGLDWFFCEDFPELDFRSGLFYSPFGAKVKYEGDGYEQESKDKLGYLAVPLTFRYSFSNGLKAEAGPDVSFVLSAKKKYTYMGQTDTNDFKDDVGKVQIGFNAGLSYTHEDSGLGGFLRYNGGLTTMPNSDYDSKIYNGGISVGVRYDINSLFD